MRISVQQHILAYNSKNRDKKILNDGYSAQVQIKTMQEQMLQEMKNFVKQEKYPAIEIESMLYNKFNIVPTYDTQYLCEQIQENVDSNELVIQPMRLTTSTIIIEYSNINFDEFKIDADWLKDQLEQMKIDNQLPVELLVLKSKKFRFLFGDTIQYEKNYFSTKNEMNSAFHIEMQSKVNPQKVYKMQLFRQGKLKICGVTTNFDNSETDRVIQQFEQFYQLLFGITIKRLGVHVVMQNFVTNTNLLTTQRIDLVNLVKFVKANPSVLQDICQKHKRNVIHFDLSQRRVVLYVKIETKRHIPKFTNNNIKSTANRKMFNSITFLLTQRGSLLLQGCNYDFQQTSDGIQLFQVILNELIHQFVINLNSTTK